MSKCRRIIKKLISWLSLFVILLVMVYISQYNKEQDTHQETRRLITVNAFNATDSSHAGNISFQLIVSV